MMAKFNINITTKFIPQCYAYTTSGVFKHYGSTKIVFSERDVETRNNEQTYTVGVDYKAWWYMCAIYMTEPFEKFTDKKIKFIETHVKEMD